MLPRKHLLLHFLQGIQRVFTGTFGLMKDDNYYRAFNIANYKLKK
jgi:hypothetical protein